MYTNIEHKLLRQRVEMAVDEALQWEHLRRGLKEKVELGWNVTMGTYEMQTSNEAAIPILLKDDAMQLLTTTLDHCYIINGEESLAVRIEELRWAFHLRRS